MAANSAETRNNPDDNHTSTTLDDLPPDFSAEDYLAANPDVAAAGMDAFEHYRSHGRAEGRRLRPRVNRSQTPEHGTTPIAANVFRGVHPEDHLFAHVQSFAPTKEQAVENYLRGGRESAEMFAALVAQYPGTRTVLEFASGYGRVTRHLKNAVPTLDVTACDIHPQANRYVSDNIGVRSIESAAVPEDFSVDRAYDMTFALSLFSHLPARTWTRWLSALVRTIRDGGIVAFTTHGRISARDQSVGFDADGFAFISASEQVDLDAADYGSAFVTPKYAFAQINSLGNARILDFSEAHWWGHQDLYVIQRDDG